MGHERWFRGQHDGQNRPFDWRAQAREHGVPERLAWTLYERAMQQARGATQVEEIYRALLVDARRDTARPAPGKVTRTMRLEAERAGKKRRNARVSPLTGQPVAPCKNTLTSYLERAVQRPAAEAPVPMEVMLRALGVTGSQTEPGRARPAAPPADFDLPYQDAIDAAFGYVAESGALAGEPDPAAAPAADASVDVAGDPWARARAMAAQLAQLLGARVRAANDLRPPGALRTTRGAGLTGAAHAHIPARAGAAPAALAAPAPRVAAVSLDRVSGARHAELEQDMIQHVLAGLDASPSQPMPGAIARRMSLALGHDFSHVRVHTGDRAAEAAALLGARAFTVGAHIYIGRGQWAPGQASFERLLAHELTHVIQHDEGRLAPGPAGRIRVAAPGDASEREAEAASSRMAEPAHLSGAAPASPSGAVPASPSAPGARPAADAGDVASPGLLPSLSDIVRMFSPELADLIDEGPLGMIRELIEAGIETFLSPITGVIEGIGDGIDGLIGSFGDVFGFIQGLFAGDPGCCQAFIDGIDRIRSIAQSVADNPAVQALRDGLGLVTGAIEDIAVLVLSPVFDVVKDLLGVAWDGISGLAGTISGWLQPILDFSRDAWNWAMEQLGIGGGEGEGGILSWLTDIASEAWSAVADTLAPVAGPLQTVAGVVAALSPVGPLVLLIQYGPDLVQAVQWLWANRNQPDIVERAHAEMGNTFLPGLLESADGFGNAMQSAATWLVTQATSLSTGLLELAGALTGVPVLGLVQGAVQAFSQGATRFADWATGALSDAVEGLQEGFARLRAFVEPYADVLCSLGMAIINPGMIPMILAGHAWMALPDCIKGPIIDLLLDAAIVVLEAMPSVPLFGLLWAVLKSGIIGFLRGLRAQPNDVKEKVSNKLARIISGSSPAFLLGFVEGFLTGVWEGLTDPFVLIWSAVQGLGNLISWFSGVAQQAITERVSPEGGGAAPSATGATASAPAAASAPAEAGLPTRGELGARAGEMAAELQPPVEQVTGGFMPAVQSLFQGGEGLTLEGLIARLRDVWASIDSAIQGAGASLATRVCEFFMGDQAEGELGRAVGWLAGTIAFEVLLGILTAGAWQPVSAAGKTLKAFARILDWTGEALGAAFRLLGRIGGLVIEALQGLRRMLGSAGSAVMTVLDALGEIGQKLLGFADELLARFGRGVADEAAEEVVEETVEEVAEETVEEVAEETAEEVAEEAGEEAAEETAEEAAEETAEEAAEETAEEAGEESAEQGGKRTDSPDLAEKQRVARLAQGEAILLHAQGQQPRTIVSMLKATFQPMYHWIQDFELEPLGVGSFQIWMIASRLPVHVLLPRTDLSPEKLQQMEDITRGIQDGTIQPTRLDSGGFGTISDVPGHPELVIKTATDSGGRANAQLFAEAQNLQRLTNEGYQTVYEGFIQWTDEAGEVYQAIVMRKVDGALSKRILQTGKFADEVPEAWMVDLVNEKTLRDLRNFRRTAEDGSVVIDDLQFMIDRDGSAYLVDPARIQDLTGMPRKHQKPLIQNYLRRIDQLIRGIERIIG